MTNPYPCLTYLGDVSEADFAQEGVVFGWDEEYRPYEVIDTDVYHGECAICDRPYLHTHLFLKYASVDAYNDQMDQFRSQVARATVRGDR